MAVPLATTDGPDCPLQVVGAGPAGMSLVLALCNRIAEDAAGPESKLLDGLQVFEAETAAGGREVSRQRS